MVDKETWLSLRDKGLVATEVETAETLRELSLSLKGLAELSEFYTWNKETVRGVDDEAISQFFIYAQKHLAAEIEGLSSAIW